MGHPDGDGHHGRSAHGVDVAECIGCSDASKGEWVVNDGHEEVGGADNAGSVTEIHDRGIVAAFVADPELG